jgi:hypothetical protein
LTKSLLCNVAAFIGMPYISESSDIQSLFLWCGNSRIMTSCKWHKLHEGYFSVQGRFCTDSNSEKSDPKKPSERCGVPFWTLISLQHPSGRRELSVRTPISVEKLRTAHDCIRPGVMANHPDTIKSSRRIQWSSASVSTTYQYRQDAIQSSTSNRVSVSNTDMGRQLQTVRTMWCSRPEAILGKASRAAEVQQSGC